MSLISLAIKFPLGIFSLNIYCFRLLLMTSKKLMIHARCQIVISSVLHTKQLSLTTTVFWVFHLPCCVIILISFISFLFNSVFILLPRTLSYYRSLFKSLYQISYQHSILLLRFLFTLLPINLSFYFTASFFLSLNIIL